MKRGFALLMILFLIALSGCETTKGLGRDIEKTGQWIQDKTD